jgi:hypothetical protein
MLTLKKSIKQYYDEVEAARALGISLEYLREILDRHIFTTEHPRPDVVEFTHADLLLISVWIEPGVPNNVLAMPPRGN